MEAKTYRFDMNPLMEFNLATRRAIADLIRRWVDDADALESSGLFDLCEFGAEFSAEIVCDGESVTVFGGFGDVTAGSKAGQDDTESEQLDGDE